MPVCISFERFELRTKVRTTKNKDKMDAPYQKKKNLLWATRHPGFVMSLADIDKLLDEKELLSAKIDELEIAMIQARGAKLQKLIVELDTLEDEKDAMKKRIKRLERQVAQTKASMPLHAPPQKMPPQFKKPKKKAPNKPVPPKPVPSTAAPTVDETKLKELEEEITKLEKIVEEKEDEEKRLRFEVESRKKELYMQESELYEREQKVLAVAMENDPTIRVVVKLQRIYRSNRQLRRWKGKVPRVKQVVEQYLASEEGKKLRARWNLIMDIYKSQKLYVENLVCVRDKYAGPLKKTNHMASGIERDDIQTIFGTIEILASFEQEILQGLYHRLFSRFTHPTIGDIFMKLSPIFSLYVEYCKNLDAIFSTLARLQKSSNKFPQYIEKLYVSSGNRNALTTLLEAPAQRLFQYETILGALYQVTDSVHVDHSLLKSILKSITEAVDQVKEFQEERKSLQQLAALKRKISNLPESVVSVVGRRLLREVDVTLILDRKRKRQKLFVFNDLVVIADISSKHYKFVDQIKTLGLRFNSLMDTESVYNGFELQTMTQVWTFVCDSYDEKVNLEKLLSSAIEEQKKVSIDGMSLKKQSTVSGLQQARLEGEISRISENLSRLPKESYEKLKTDRYIGILELLKEPSLLRALLRNIHAAVLVAEILEAYELIHAVVTKNFLSDDSEFKVETGSIASDLMGSAGVFLGKSWMSGVMGKLVPEMVSKSSNADRISQAIAQNLANSVKDIPPLFQDVVYHFRQTAKRKFKDKADEVTGSFFLSISVFFVVRYAFKFQFCQPDEPISLSYITSIQKAISPASMSNILDACVEQKKLPAPKVRQQKKIIFFFSHFLFSSPRNDVRRHYFRI